MSVDLLTCQLGSITILTPVSTAARQWMNANVQFEPWQEQAGGIVVEHGTAAAIIEAADDAGFLIEPS